MLIQDYQLSSEIPFKINIAHHLPFINKAIIFLSSRRPSSSFHKEGQTPQLLQSHHPILLFYCMNLTYSIPKSSRQYLVQHVPAPNNYHTQQLILQNHNPEYTFARDSRFKLRIESPGPGEYNSQDTIVKEKRPSYSMFKRMEQAKKQYNIGPGDYSPNYTIKASLNPSYSFLGYGHSFKDINPGPGEYQTKSMFYKKEYKKSKHTFMAKLKERRIQTPEKSELKENKRGSAKSSDVWNEFKATFNQLPPQEDTPSHKQTLSSRKPSCQSSMPFNIQYGFSPQKIINTINYSPAPTSYHPHTTTPTTITIKQKIQYSYDNKIPGPGAYSSELDISGWQKGKNKFSLGREKRMLDGSRGVPGPGAYDDVSVMRRGKITFGQEEKMKGQAKLIPSPADYKIKSIFGESNVG